ncbi:uncharacterized protein PHALS_15297 [Plasmopara halstedii]|uniref:Uncharacterized protein n=1 Tax=Plasmopara halstedii TaxID=4781 RepID=A0A0N7L4B9_PLAHL|nr:uncharacterized protein PHALS_15297 [Plasmopara halstedii]CEG38243.1 hypothetical protein PHALS_15297 [Plasmopara halstedii]|eukprot:XP_024574612.1 hypothetical protein PHALS_15297 [Plasmopara halstedii]
MYETEDVVDVEYTDYTTSLDINHFESIVTDPGVEHEDTDERVTFHTSNFIIKLKASMQDNKNLGYEYVADLILWISL